MANMNELALTLIDNETGDALVLPIRPIDDSAEYKDGDQLPKSVTILDVGAVEIPGLEVDLDSIGWNSFFPGAYDSSLCDVDEGKLKSPEEYRNLFSSWKDNGTSLQLVWPWAFLNKTVYLKSFSWKPPTAAGDVFYSVAFRELRELAPRLVSTTADEVTLGVGAADRADIPEAAAPQTYTVQSGDTLTGIAKQYGVTPWREKLYEPNKDTIGSDPNKLAVGLVLSL